MYVLTCIKVDHISLWCSDRLNWWVAFKLYLSHIINDSWVLHYWQLCDSWLTLVPMTDSPAVYSVYWTYLNWISFWTESIDSITNNFTLRLSGSQLHNSLTPSDFNWCIIPHYYLSATRVHYALHYSCWFVSEKSQ